MRNTVNYLLLLLFSVFLTNGFSQDKVGSSAPGFSGKTTDGKVINLADLKGKVVLVDFWASWCMPCREEMPELIKFYKQHKNPAFEMLAVNIDKDKNNMQHFLDELFPQPSFPIIVDDNQEIPALFNIEAMPTTLIIDKKGTIRFWHNGFKKSYVDDYNTELTQLLKEN
jgi:thiol-disulfide isomerase/thioredoxin